MFRRSNYSGYLLDDRAAVLAAVATAGVRPAHAHVVAEHVTHAYPDPVKAPQAGVVCIVGYAADDNADTLIVSVDGGVYRPDGRVYHLTFSLADGVRPAYAAGLAERSYASGAWTELPEPVPVAVTAF